MEPRGGLRRSRRLMRVASGASTGSASDGSDALPTNRSRTRASRRYRSGNPGTLYGSVASGRSALSANGSEVVFVTTAVSNLDGPETPALQVAVRDLDTDSTQLVSVALRPGDRERPRSIRRPDGRNRSRAKKEGSHTARSTPQAAPTAVQTARRIRLCNRPWARRSAPTARRSHGWARTSRAKRGCSPAKPCRPSTASRCGGASLTGPKRPRGGSPAARTPPTPACAASGETILPPPASFSDPCQGPFADRSAWRLDRRHGQSHVRSSATTARPSRSWPTRRRSGATSAKPQPSPAICTWRTCPQGSRAPKRCVRSPSSPAATLRNRPPPRRSSILASLPTAARSRSRPSARVFPLGSPAYVSAPAATPGMVELFDVDLADDTLTRVTHGFEGGASEAPHGSEVSGQDPYPDTDGALSPSFSDNGDTLAFSSTASNLVYGDGNTPQQVATARRSTAATRSSSSRDGLQHATHHRSTSRRHRPIRRLHRPGAWA